MPTPVETGFDADGDLASFLLAALSPTIDGWTLISRLDSADLNAESPTIRTATAKFVTELEWTTGGLILPTRRVSQLLAAGNLFFGFDEVVAFDDRSAAQRATCPPVFTTDHEPLVAASEGAIRAYIELHTVRVAAADGLGVRWFRRNTVLDD